MSGSFVQTHRKELEFFISSALAEDIGEGDHSSLASIPENKIGKASLFVKENGVLAGVELAEFIFKSYSDGMKMDIHLKDGSVVENGMTAFQIEGYIRDILKLERLTLNCMQRMSGIATQTAALVKLLEGTNTKLLDTRKTTPNNRLLEKWAVTLGGGNNHRFGLYDMIMLKDNHIDGAGGIEMAIKATHDYLKKQNLKLKIEIESRNLEEVKEVLKVGGVNRIMLDNFTPELLKEAIQLINGKFETEASGGITSENVRSYAETGVDFISTSSITHSVKSLDLSLKIVN